MNCLKCNAPLPDTVKSCDSCGAAVETQAAKFAAPNGFLLDGASGLYYRMENDPQSGEVVGATWFNAVTGEYKQSRYAANKTDVPTLAGSAVPAALPSSMPLETSLQPTAAAPVPEGFTEDPQSGLYYRSTASFHPQTGQKEQWVTWYDQRDGSYRQECLTPPAAGAGQPSEGARLNDLQPEHPGTKPAKGKKTLITVLVAVLLLSAAGAAVWLTGLYKDIPFLNPPAQTTPSPGIETADPSETPQPSPRRESVDHKAHISTEFTVSADDAGNAQTIDGILILFDGAQPKVTEEDITDAVMTQNGQPIPISYEVICTVLQDLEDASAQTSCEILFDPSFAGQAAEEGIYAFSCNIDGVAYRTGDFYFAPPPETDGVNWAAVYSDFLQTQFYTTKEYLHYSDWGIFPVHTLGESEAAVMQAIFYEIPGFDYPVLSLLEFLPQTNNPDVLDTFHFEIVYLIKDGKVTWDRTEEETAAIYYENEESGMTFVNGAPIVNFELVSWEGGASVEENMQVLHDWLAEQTAATAAGGEVSESQSDVLLDILDSYTMQDLIDNGSIIGGDPDFVEAGMMYYRAQLPDMTTDAYIVFVFQDPPRPAELRVEAVQVSLTELLGESRVSLDELEEIFGGLDMEQGLSEEGGVVITASAVIGGLRFRFIGDEAGWFYDVYLARD